MKVKDLKISIEETLGLDVISWKGLLVCINNCIAKLHAKDYRNFIQETTNLAEDKRAFPINIDLPSTLKNIVYLKVKTSEGIYLAKRVSLAEEGLESQVINGVYRMEGDERELIFYVLHDKIYIDTTINEMIVEAITLGYYKRIPKMDLALPEEALDGNDSSDPVVEQATIEIREAFEDAFVFFGLSFFANRFKLNPEIKTEYDKEFKYFVEDMSNELDKEDLFLERSWIDVDPL